MNQNICEDLTIIMPNYNCARYLPTSLQSILSQSLLPKEIVIVDDGSTDNSLEVIKQFQDKYKIITLLQNEVNQGVNPTANRGFNYAKTKYVMSFAVDDWLLPGFIEQSINILSANPQAGMCSTNSLVCWEDHNNRICQYSLTKPLKNSGFVEPKLASQLLYKNGSWFMGNSVIMNREMAGEFGFYRDELKSFSDNFLYRQLALKYGVCFIPNNLSVWRIRKKGFSQTTYQDYNKHVSIMRNYINLMEKEYPKLFSSDMIKRESRRWLFLVSCTNINSNKSGIIRKLTNRIHSALLFVYLKPFDVIPMLSRKTKHLISLTKELISENKACNMS